MTTISDLQSSFENVIGTISQNTNVNLIRNANDAIYATYVFGLILKAIRIVADPNSIRLTSISAGMLNSNPTTFIIRGSPGYIYSANSDYGYAVFQYFGISYEVHLGVRYYGSSHVLHEFDISILTSDDARRCRQNRSCPSSGKPCAIFECKFYTNNLGIELGREFVGLVSDFPGVQIRRLVTNSNSDSIQVYLGKGTRPRFNGLVVPSNPETENGFVYAVADDLKTKLR